MLWEKISTLLPCVNRKSPNITAMFPKNNLLLVLNWLESFKPNIINIYVESPTNIYYGYQKHEMAFIKQAITKQKSHKRELT